MGYSVGDSIGSYKVYEDGNIDGTTNVSSLVQGVL